MDLERLLIDWQEQKFEGYLFETPPSVIVADIRKEDAKRKRKYRLRIYATIGLTILVAAASVLAMSMEHSLSARIVTFLLAAAILHELIWMSKWRALENEKRYDLPRKRFLIEERKRILRQIRRTRWQITWCAAALGAPYGIAIPRMPISRQSHSSYADRHETLLPTFSA